MYLCWCYLFTLIVAITVKSSLQTTRCPPLHLTNGRVRLRAAGRMATFRCDPKFRIVGARHAMCLSSGMWNFQKTPMCLGTECPQIDVLAGGTIKELYNGSMLEFECALDLRLEGSQRILCLGTSWDSVPPTCISDIVLPLNNTGCDHEDQRLCTPSDYLDYDANRTSTLFSREHSGSDNKTYTDLSALVSPVTMTGCDYEDQTLCAQIDDSDYDANWTRTQVDTVTPSLNNASYSADLESPPNITECEYEDQSLCTWTVYDYDFNSTSIQDGRLSSELNSTSDSVNITGCDYEDQSHCTWTDNRAYDLNWTSTEDGIAISEFVNTTVSVETTTSAAEVTTSHGHHDITCTESRMEFSIPLSSPHTSETATLSDPNCQINVTRTHVRGGVDLNSCGTTVQFQNDSVIFRNAIIFSAPESSSLGSSGSNSSVSQYQDIIPIQCVYNRIATVHLSYMPVVRRVLFTESGVGQFSFNIQQFWDASFTNMVSDRAYPLRMELDADVFIQLSVGSEGQPVAGHEEIGMEVQQCLVSPSSSVIEAQLHYYPLIQDGCPASSDVHIIPNTNASDSTVMRFRFRAVNFFDPSSSSSSSLVFVHCRMGLCLTGSCKPSAWSCLTPPARRVRRDVDQSKRAAHQLSTGPFLIMADEASTSSSSTTATVMAVVSTSVATVAIVIAAIALIALRRRRTTARN